MKSETLTISRYKPQFCSGEVSGPLFLNLARFQNYWRTTSHSLDSSFDFTLFLRVPLFVCSVEDSLKLMYFHPSYLKTSVFNWQLLASPGVSSTFTNWCIVRQTSPSKGTSLQGSRAGSIIPGRLLHDTRIFCGHFALFLSRIPYSKIEMALEKRSTRLLFVYSARELS